MEEANRAFEERCRSRHSTGQREYGVATFLAAPTIDMAMEEAADLSNYMRYTFIKLYILQRVTAHLTKETDEMAARTDSHGFTPMSEVFRAFGMQS
jgi:hypothetical protein